MGLTGILEAIHQVIVHLVGGSYTPTGASAAVTVAFANSWVGSFLATITPENGLFFIGAILAFTLFGIHVLKSLMGR